MWDENEERVENETDKATKGGGSGCEGGGSGSKENKQKEAKREKQSGRLVRARTLCSIARRWRKRSVGRRESETSSETERRNGSFGIA